MSEAEATDLAARLAERLTTRWLGRSHRHLPKTGSTNDDAAAWSDAPHGALVTADAQHAGRGRLGRVWFSPPGAHLYASVVVRPRIADERWAALGLAVGLGLRDGLLGLCDRVALKWPNDLLVDGRKLAGILCEARWQGTTPHIVVGFGINVMPEAFPPELAEAAVTLGELVGAPVDRATVLASVLAGLEPMIDRIEHEGFAALRPRYERACCSIGRLARVELHGRPTDVVVRGVDDDGALVVAPHDDPDGATMRVTSGELTPPSAR